MMNKKLVLFFGILLICIFIGADIYENIKMRADETVTFQAILRKNLAMGIAILVEIVFVVMAYLRA